MRVFLGITGASGAPYAARLVQALGRAECEVGLCASRAGIEVLRTELYGDERLSADEALARLVEPVRDSVTLYDEQDWSAPYASGSARVLVLMPRETPLSAIHLEAMLKLRQAGAVVLFLAPGFYHGAETVGDLVDFMVARCLDQLGIEQGLVREWGAAKPPVRASGPGERVWGNREAPPASREEPR